MTGSRIQDLKRRWARLHRCAKVPFDVQRELPLGVEFIWNGMETLLRFCDQVKSESKEANKITRSMETAISDLKGDMSTLALTLSEHRQKEHNRYHKETARVLDELDKSLISLEEQGIDAQSVRAMLQRMRNNVYPQ